MEVPQSHINFNSQSFQEFHNQENLNQSSLNKMNPKNFSEKERINLFHEELENNVKRIKESLNKCPRKSGNLFHFNFNIDLIEFPSNDKIIEKKRNSFSYIDMSFMKNKEENNMNYVGFENNYGENSCYINVILHFLYYFPSVNDYLIKFYKNKIDIFNNINSEISILKNIDYFLFLLGKTLFEYQKNLSNINGKNITILNTKEFRHNLQEVSNNLYGLNQIGDPVELLIFLLDKINEYNPIEIHNDFFINLIEEIKCDICYKNKLNNFDKNNFIYYINACEIINNINKRHKPFSEYAYKLFKFANKFNSNCENKCEYCGSLLKKKIKYIGSNYPKYLLLNCAWEKNQNINDVIKFLYLLPLEDHLNNLFSIENEISDKSLYNLLGMILYSSALSHYISVIFNMEKNIFILYDDDKIKELSSIHEVYKEITSEQIKKNPNVFFYPVLLIYYREILYNDDKTIELNDYSEHKFQLLEQYCLNAINNHKVLTMEQKRQNYLEYVKAQNIYDIRRKFSMESLNSSFDMIIEEEQKNIINNKTKFSDDIIYKNIYSNMKMDIKENNTNNNMFVEENYKSQEKYEIKRTNKRSETQYRNNYQYKSFDFFKNIM